MSPFIGGRGRKAFSNGHFVKATLVPLSSQ
jgi:hypothetical protein